MQQLQDRRGGKLSEPEEKKRCNIQVNHYSKFMFNIYDLERCGNHIQIIHSNKLSTQSANSVFE